MTLTPKDYENHSYKSHYVSLREASLVAHALRKHKGGLVFPYICPVCDTYVLGHVLSVSGVKLKLREIEYYEELERELEDLEKGANDESECETG